MKIVALLLGLYGFAYSQEADSGLEVRANLTASAMVSPELGDAPRFGSPLASGLRAMVYPTWKVNRNWTIASALQLHTRPFFREQFRTQGSGARADVLQLHLSYSRFWKNNSIVVRAGQLSTAFGSFLLRYDDAVNPLIDMPLMYGYYYKPVTTLGLIGTQVDLTAGKVDLRAQLTSSSPGNRRSVFDSDQYANWAGGAGYTIQQGLRVGMSAFRGPYLHRQHRFFFPGEAPPRELPASAIGIDGEWIRGHWTTRAEGQTFSRAYRAIPTFTQRGWYGEVRRALHPRWYVAGRTGALLSSVGGTVQAHEITAGFRPAPRALVKFGYLVPQGGGLKNVFTVQLITTLQPFVWVR